MAKIKTFLEVDVTEIRPDKFGYTPLHKFNGKFYELIPLEDANIFNVSGLWDFVSVKNKTHQFSQTVMRPYTKYKTQGKTYLATIYNDSDRMVMLFFGNAGLNTIEFEWTSDFITNVDSLVAAMQKHDIHMISAWEFDSSEESNFNLRFCQEIDDAPAD